jgi:hypothetical protein
MEMYDYENQLHAMLHSEDSIFIFCYPNYFYFADNRSPMDDFAIDCCFNSGYEGLKFRELTPRYAKLTQHNVA